MVRLQNDQIPMMKCTDLAKMILTFLILCTAANNSYASTHVPHSAIITSFNSVLNW